MARGIRKTVWYDDPPEVVWVALTDPRAIAEWLMPNTFKAEIGHRFTFRTDPMPMCEERTECEVIELDPPRRLAYTWLIVWGRKVKRPAQPMIVRWTLTPERGGTTLVFEQSEYHGPRAWFTRLTMNMGWGHMHRRLLRRVIKNVRNGVFQPGAIPANRRVYRARTLPSEYVR